MERNLMDAPAAEQESLRSILKADIQRYVGTQERGGLHVVKEVLLHECLLFVVLYRIAQRIIRIRNRWLQGILKVCYVYTIFRFYSLFVGIEVHLTARIGKGFYIGHFGDIHIGPVAMGSNCNVSQGVTIGEGRFGTDQFGIPTLGNNVYIAPGAKLFGKITIGNNVSIGANAVVSKTIPDNAIVLGNPGRIIGYQEDNPQIQNPERGASS